MVQVRLRVEIHGHGHLINSMLILCLLGSNAVSLFSIRP